MRWTFGFVGAEEVVGVRGVRVGGRWRVCESTVEECGREGFGYFLGGRAGQAIDAPR